MADLRYLVQLDAGRCTVMFAPELTEQERFRITTRIRNHLRTGVVLVEKPFPKE